MKTKGVNRRLFLRLSAAGSGSLLLPKLGNGASAASLLPATNEIPVRKLGKTGVELPILSMGVMRADNPNIVRAAYNSGLFHFDTAHGYQGGKNEEMLGDFFRDKSRDSFFLATKIKLGYPLTEDTVQELANRFATSLERLKLNHVDLLYAHALGREEEVTDPALMSALKKLKESGKTRFLGFSTHAQKPALIDAGVKAGIYDVILVSYNFKLNNLEETETAIERAAKAGIGVVAMKTMTGGVEDAEGKKKINAQACLKWVWQNPNITTIIPGFTNYEQLEECLAAAHDPAMTGEEKEYLAGLSGSEMMFCQRCGKCTEQCTNHLPVPELMRAYMYAYGYKYARLSKETLTEFGVNGNPCAGCSTCRIKCPSGFNVAGKIAAVTPLLGVPDELLS